MAQYAQRLLLGLLVLSSNAVMAAFARDSVSIIPRPNAIELHEGTYTYGNPTPLYAFEQFTEVAQLLATHPYAQFAPVERIRSHKRIPESGIRLIQARSEDRVPAQGYLLRVDTTGILITAGDADGMRQGILTLLQLAHTQRDGRTLPAMLIQDQPRFGYRGLLLDASSHYYPVPFIKQFIDVMALYKFNRFHWHLTGPAGWRLEIKRHPELTQRGAWRTHVDWSSWWQQGRQYVEAGHPNASGGYYTQDEVRELVAHAAQKGITIIPGIGLPRQADGATSDRFNAVLGEVCQLFPASHIHVGDHRVDGDGQPPVDSLQRQLLKQADSLLKTHGRKLIGWDDPAEPGIAGGDAVMAPPSHLHFDHDQADPRVAPVAVGGVTTLAHVYAYDGAPSEATETHQRNILGIQGNTWTEYMPTADQVMYMAFPRALALAEVAWTDAKHRNWVDFSKRLQRHYAVLQRFGVNYYRPAYTVDIGVRFNADTLTNTISMATEQYVAGIRYTTDGEEPDGKSPLYTKPIELAVPSTVKAAYFLDSTRVGPIAVAKADIHKAIGKAITYQTKWDTYAADEERTLLNGQKGSLRAADGHWQGFANNLDVAIDFERREALGTVSISFLQDTALQVFLPGEVKVLLSDNGKNYREAGTIDTDTCDDGKYQRIEAYTFRFDEPQAARYLRIVATNARQALLLADEIVVY